MATPIIEHVNLTVSDNRRAAALFERLFGWHIRWEGPARDGGHSIHVGDERYYLALYTPRGAANGGEGFAKGEPLNHVGLLVEDLAAVKAGVVAAGLEPFNHERYDPGERFYFFDWDGIEYEIVSYA
jgi:catechol 2,3-dioxygenase-like lactoylglutathione lyase family enzyme